VRKFKFQKFSPTTKEVRNFKHFSVDDFRSDLLQVPWDMIFTLYNPNACWILCKSFVDEILNKHAPLCNKRIRSRQSRWITPVIKQLMDYRDFHKKAIKFNSRYHWSKYQNLRNKVNIEMKLGKSHFYQCEFQNCSRSSDLRKTWSLINYLIGKNNKSKINEIIVNNNTISDPNVIAESFNDYFVNIGPKLASEASIEFHDEGLPNNCSRPGSISNSPFCFFEISIANVSMTLRNLKANKSTGLDKIPTKILKLASDIIASSGLLWDLNSP
jgi:hypothetical protein